MKNPNASGASHFGDVRLAIEYVPIDRLQLPERKVRLHTARQIKALGKSLRDFGAIIPIVVDRSDVVFVGAAIVEAARDIALKDLPAVRITHLDDHQLRLFRIAHTKLSDGGSWDFSRARRNGRRCLRRRIRQRQALDVSGARRRR